jgi:ABC-type uncharacterized transport system YnjBCD ATPase subunit
MLFNYIKSLFQYAGRMAWVSLGLMILLGLTQGISLVMIIPFLHVIGIQSSNGTNGYAQKFVEFMEFIGAQPTFFSVICTYLVIVSIHACAIRYKDILTARIVYGFTQYLSNRLYTRFCHADWLCFLKTRDARNDLYTLVTDHIGGMKVSKSYNLEEHHKNNFFATTKSITNQMIRFTKINTATRLCYQVGAAFAIAGQSGAGKSSIADLILGLLTPDQGRISVDGTRLSGNLLYSWRRAVGYVPQETFLFHESIRDNLKKAHPSASDAQLWEALDNASARAFVSNLPKGIDTIVGDRGVKLSGGERQRIALARALLGTYHNCCHCPQVLHD